MLKIFVYLFRLQFHMEYNFHHYLDTNFLNNHYNSNNYFQICIEFQEVNNCYWRGNSLVNKHNKFQSCILHSLKDIFHYNYFLKILIYIEDNKNQRYKLHNFKSIGYMLISPQGNSLNDIENIGLVKYSSGNFESNLSIVHFPHNILIYIAELLIRYRAQLL